MLEAFGSMLVGSSEKPLERFKNSLFEGRAPFCEEAWNQEAFDTTRNERTLCKREIDKFPF